MDKTNRIAKVVWEARKAIRPWNGDNPIKKWSSAYPAEKSVVTEAIKVYLADGTIPVIKDWEKEEIGLLCKISEYLNAELV